MRFAPEVKPRAGRLQNPSSFILRDILISQHEVLKVDLIFIVSHETLYL